MQKCQKTDISLRLGRADPLEPKYFGPVKIEAFLKEPTIYMCFAPFGKHLFHLGAEFLAARDRSALTINNERLPQAQPPLI